MWEREDEQRPLFNLFLFCFHRSFLRGSPQRHNCASFFFFVSTPARRRFFEVVYQWLDYPVVYVYTPGSENSLACIVTEMRLHSSGALAVKVPPPPPPPSRKARGRKIKA
ncbi:uncharacterized protein PgNI_07331 [Pyricularia grisea]|uniref:Uncharacterized protein n=1 Tax=Pyricularia grisea TaxID=148305 RepID=A0A6P8B0U4_PYRGI|nr:uncharacterized protein PgNI_07331 [Pyricularia grisea]TLD08525.1 hypothetical protein PgNI_07331 [Pyricularia grisea]